MTPTNAAPKLGVQEVRLYERDQKLRMPFRFGVATMTESPQAYAHVRIRLVDGREGWGVAGEMLAAKWFDKDLSLSNEDNYRQLRAALGIAGDAYRAAGPATAFDLFAGSYRAQIDAGAAAGLNPITACYGPALLDRAVLDALCRLHDVSFADAIRRNLPGIRRSDLAPDLEDFDLDTFLAGLKPGASIHARHTVGMVDPITANPEPVNDGLPETLADVIATYGHRYFKIKVGGDLAADLARLEEIAAALDVIDGEYLVSLDGNEQYREASTVIELLRAIAARPALTRFNEAILFVEQPIARAVALDGDIWALSTYKPVIIDESDGTLDTFPTAKELGYAGVSSKTCKGFYKSILNRARCARWNTRADGPRYFMSAEDLTTPAGVTVQQDLALVSLLGIDHVERNGHHYINGMAAAPAAEQRAFLAAHPDLYHDAGGTARLTIRDGRIALGSLACAGFATAAMPDFGSMREMSMPG